MPACLVLTAAPVASQDDLTTLLAAQGLSDAAPLALATSSGALAAGALPPAAYDAVVSVAQAAGHHTVALLGLLGAALKPGGKLVVQEPGSSAEALQKALLLSGFPGAIAAPGGGVAATKPAWATGAKAAIALKPRAQQQQQPAAATWTLGGDDDELVDDEELLTEEDKARPAAPAANDDCEVGAAGRKACKNCTCGRAEEGPDAKPAQLTKEMLDNPTSGCGSCGLGDAFRCAGCPYRGLPAFEMGKKIELPSDFLAVDL
ncbi:anamorsin-like protein [Chlorella sorokiniana]|jgi:hypothetical protein|uniref:Anamorsin homolog n=1 Tax=Chlorella sorokiniana TaxID=3076 RepID=A0A2P6TP36_CHLSO|nr:anamorsin-like protein [Chlorella sorokiniana]|eukprot:PRW51069.1 anamorsin-like protein [Chlorella sorokiniana]